MPITSKLRSFFLPVCLLASILAAHPVMSAENEAEISPIQTELAKQRQPIDAYTLNLTDLNNVYQAHGYKPAWRTKSESDRAALISFVDTMERFAAANGLQSDVRPAHAIRKLLAENTENNSLKLELLATDWLIKIAHDLYGDHVHLSQLYVGWNFKRPQRNVIPELADAIRNNAVNEYLASLIPSGQDYAQLVTALQSYRAMSAKGPWPTVTSGPTIKPQTSDPRIEQVRARLEAEGYTVPAPAHNPHLYTDDLKDVVISYQSRNGLEADGNIGSKTFAAMNISLAHRIEQIIANMERLRHMPRLYPSRYAVVNIANATVKVFDNDALIYHEPVVIGRPDRKTPFIHSAIRSVIFNPSWHVPSKIAREDILPKLRKDPHYLEKMGFVLNSDDEGDSAGTSVDWNTIKQSEFAFRLRQAPGELNSLGRIKFDFDNNFSVYMHGTPHEELFAKAARNLSSGCIRLKDPDQFAVVVLRNNEGNWGLEKVQGEINKKKTRWLKVESQLPLYVIYQTVFSDMPNGPVNFRNDVYNYDRILIEALNQKGD